jgi:hypothetical protein
VNIRFKMRNRDRHQDELENILARCYMLLTENRTQRDSSSSLPVTNHDAGLEGVNDEITHAFLIGNLCR